MTTLRMEHQISDFATWKAAFDTDPLDRAGSGVRAHRIHRPLDDPAYIIVDLDFDGPTEAEAFRVALERLWTSPRATPALRGTGRARVVETVEDVVHATAAV